MHSPADRTRNRAALQPRRAEFQADFENFRTRGLDLDITRGKPSSAQLDLANDILALPGGNYLDGAVDTRNYGGLDGLPGMKALFAEMLDVPPSNVIVGGSSSLNMMFDTLARGCLFGTPGGDRPWSAVPGRKFLCPVPGYDRHFAVTEHLGFELIPVAMDENGPDMAQVESLVAADHDIKGIWCVPRYSNPTGCTYSDEVASRLASMPAAADFRIIWDNAYAEHHLVAPAAPLANIFSLCAEAGNPDRVIGFASTSKISHPGSGVAALAASDTNIAGIKRHLAVQTIGPDKVNQLRHLQLFGDIGGLRAHMQKHAALVKPKFDLVDEILVRELGDLGVAQWTRPTGGYFISLDVPDGTAKRVVALAAEAGVKLTAAGAPFPGGHDSDDRNIRIAPTFPELAEVGLATEVLAACVKLAASE